MIEAAFTPYVKNIPWKEYEHQIFEEDIDKYISNIEHILGENTDRLEKIDFNDDLWDFSSYRPDLDPSTLRLHMRNCNVCYKSFLKFFVLNRLAERLGIRSTIRTARNILSILESILDCKRTKSISLITNEDIKNEIYRRNTADATSEKLFSDIACFYSFIEGNVVRDIYSPSYAHDPNHWFYLYTDEGSSYITVRNNWTPTEKYLKNANGPGNTWENNGPNVPDSIKAQAGITPETK